MQRLPQGLEVRYEWQKFKSPGDTHSRVVGYSPSTGEQVRIQYTLRPDGSGTAQSIDPMHRSHLWAWDSLKRVTHYQNPVDGQFTLTWVNTSASTRGDIRDAASSASDLPLKLANALRPPSLAFVFRARQTLQSAYIAW